MFGFFKRRRRRRLLATPLPQAWWTIIDGNVPMIREMFDADRAELGGVVQVLLSEKTFEGCGGFVITDEVRLTIAAQAGVLLLHRQTDYYPTLRTILVYPQAYIAEHQQVQADGSVIEGPQSRLGESWYGGALILSWNDVLYSAAEERDGHNVTLHEFAHQLDGVATGMDGAPALPSQARYRDWARVLGDEYQSLVEGLHFKHHSLIDSYGATNPAEFFAVVTELYFERPKDMKQAHPELYAEVDRFYSGRD